MSYRHTQPGTTMIASCLLGGVFTVAMAWHSGQWPGGIAVMVLMVATEMLAFMHGVTRSAPQQ